VPYLPFSEFLNFIGNFIARYSTLRVEVLQKLRETGFIARKTV
jgi:hypothetical protein